MAIELIATGRSIPSRRITNDELAKQLDTTDEWIRSHTGIGSRHLIDDKTACSDLALESAWDALGQAVEQGLVQEPSAEALAETLDVIVLGTSSPDYFGAPASACIVQHKLGASHCCAMDISAGCSGFLYGLETAAGLLAAAEGRKRALVIGADVLSLFVDWQDRSTCVLFGDGAAAALVEKTGAPSKGPEKRGIIRTILGADGSGETHLLMRRGGSRHPYHAGERIDLPPHYEMKGQAVYTFAVKIMIELIEQLLEEEGISLDAVKRIVPHQANARIIQAAGKRLNIPEEKFFMNINEYANTSAASIPIALDEMNRNGLLRRGDMIMLIAFGAGLTYGGSLLVW